MYRLFLLGGASVEADTGPLSGRIAQRRQLALLAILAGRRGGPVTREKLVGLLWPESPEDRARRLLSDTVYVIRQELGADALVKVGNALQIDPDLVWNDVDAFRAALDEDRLLEAAESYRGPFMDGFHLEGAHEFDRWMEEERRDLADRYVAALEELAERAESPGVEAIRWWTRRNAAEPSNSRVALRLAEALVAAGDHAGAAEHIRHHERVLHEEIGVGLPPEFDALLAGLPKAREESALPVPEPPREVMRAPAPRPVGARAAFPGPAASRAGTHRTWLVASVVVLTLGFFAWGPFGIAELRETRAPSSLASLIAPPTPVASVAVLPFEELDGAGTDYFAPGLTEDIRVRLARSPEVAVISPGAAEWAWIEEGAALADVGNRLGADYLVRGSVRRGDDRIRIAAELIDGRSGRSLWSESFDRAPRDLLLLQSDLASRIAGRLGARDAPEAAAGVGDAVPTNIEAYDLFLEARWLWHRSMAGQWVPMSSSASPEELRRMVELLQRSIALDSTYAPAHAVLGDVLATWRLGIPPDSGLAALNRALALDDRLPLGHHGLARHMYLREGRIAEARQRAARALELDASYLPAMVSFAEMSDGVGALDEAFLWAQRAWTIAPHAPSWYRAEWVARVHWLTGSPELARPILQRLSEVDGGPRGRLARGRLADLDLTEGRIEAARRIASQLHESGEEAPQQSLNRLALVELHAGRWDQAVVHLEELLGMLEGQHDHNTVAWSVQQMAPTNLGFAYRKLGRIEESDAMLARSVAFQEEALTAGRLTTAHHFDLGRIAAIRGDVEGALTHIEQALAGGWMYAHTFLGENAPQLEALRGEPRFQAWMDREKARLDAIGVQLASMGLDDWTLETIFSAHGTDAR